MDNNALLIQLLLDKQSEVEQYKQEVAHLRVEVEALRTPAQRPG